MRAAQRAATATVCWRDKLAALGEPGSRRGRSAGVGVALVMVAVAAAGAAPAGATAQDSPLVRVDTFAPGLQVQCRAERTDADGRVTRLATGPPLEWAGRAGDRIQCDADGAEPLDLVVGDPPLARYTLSLARAARTLLIRAPAGDWPPRDQIVIEWRRPDTGGSHLLAARLHEGAGDVRVPVASETRWVRVRRTGAAPVTVPLPPGTADVAVTLPPPTPGGELVAALPPRRILPVAIILQGPAETRDAPVVGGWVGVPGLRPGRYRLVPIYPPGVSGEAIEGAVRDGETTELVPPAFAPVGAAEIVLAEELCAEHLWPARLTITRHRGTSVSVRYERAFSAELPEGQCHVRVEGLSVGRHDIVLGPSQPADRPDRPPRKTTLSRADFLIVDDTVTPVTLGAPAVRVHGRVTYEDGRPAPDLVVGFELRDSQVAEASTDAMGRYDAVLPEPGTYRVRIGPTFYLSVARVTRRFEAGDQEADFSIAPGRLRLHVRTVRGEPPDDVVQVEIERLGSGEASREGRVTTGFIGPEHGGEVEVVGLGLGRYRVRAWQPGGKAAVDPPVLVDLTERVPVADVDLWLRSPSAARVRVVDSAGSPLGGAYVLAGPVVLQEEAPGVFPLVGQSEGARISVERRGAVPSCRVWRGEPEVLVRLMPPAGAMVFRFSPPVRAPLGVVVGIPDADCDVGLSQFDYRLQSTATETLVEVSNFPAGRFILRVLQGDRWVDYPFTAPGEEVRVRLAR